MSLIKAPLMVSGGGLPRRGGVHISSRVSKPPTQLLPHSSGPLAWNKVPSYIPILQVEQLGHRGS